MPKFKMCRRSKILVLVLTSMAFLGFCPKVFAITNTELPPEGRRAAAFVFAIAPNVSSEFNNSGSLESLVQPLNRSVNEAQMAAANPRLQKLQTVLDAIGPDHIGDELLAANLSSQINIQETRYYAGFLYSLTDDFAIGFELPIIHRATQVNFQADVQNNAAKVAAIVGNTPALAAGLQELKNTQINTATFSDAIFTANGYKTPQNFDLQGLGDLQLEARWRHYNGDRFKLQSRFGITVPTATHDADITNLFDRDLGQGDFSFRAGEYADLHLIPHRLFWNSAVMATVHAVSHPTLAARSSPSEILPDLNNPADVETMTRMQGADFEFDSGLELDFFNSVFCLSATYVYTLHAQDMYSGTKSMDYEYLMQDTNTQVHSTEFAMEYSTVPLFLHHSFPIPARLALSWVQPWTGTSGLYTPYGRVDVLVLF